MATLIRALPPLFATAVAGCALLAALTGPPADGFPHRVHAAEGLDCEICHATATTEAKAGAPTAEGCRMCHEGLDAEKPPERKAERLLDGDAVRTPYRTALGDEIRFSHAAHAKAGVTCTECHGDVAAQGVLDASVRLTKPDCLACHAERGRREDCGACHLHVGRATRPASHAHDWSRAHGAAVRAKTGASADRCELCHSESGCTACHATQAPASHTNHFRLATHGLVAGMDREACLVCHQPDACIRCHRETEPRSHTGAFGSPKNTHCLTCHTGNADGGCALCHSQTPSHSLAAPQPAWHVPGMNCRQCHGFGAPMPHVDDGGDCSSCHK